MKKTLLVLVAIFMCISASPAFAITGSDITNGTVTGTDLADGTVKGIDIGSGTITSSDIQDGSLKGIDILNGSITGSDLAANLSVQNVLVTDTLAVVNFVAISVEVSDNFSLSSEPRISTIPDDSTLASQAQLTIDTSGSYPFMAVNCQDSDGCLVSLDETGFTDGSLMTIYNEGANSVTIVDTPGVSELAGSYTMGQWDSIQLIYRAVDSDGRWIEVNRSNN